MFLLSCLPHEHHPNEGHAPQDILVLLVHVYSVNIDE